MLAYSTWTQREAAGLCPECGERLHKDGCRKRLFDLAYSIGFHDGANRLERHSHAFVVEMIEQGEYESDGVDQRMDESGIPDMHLTPPLKF
jgi:hypothetical protein